MIVVAWIWHNNQCSVTLFEFLPDEISPMLNMFCVICVLTMDIYTNCTYYGIKHDDSKSVAIKQSIANPIIF